MSVIPSGGWRDIFMEEVMAGKREQQMKEITERLEQGVKELFTSEMYTEYLKTMSQFHNYSFNNTLLIAMQKPDATLVAGYQAWQKKFKRQVKKGEKGIQIIAPAPIREKEEIEKFDPETNEPILRPDGQPETEEVVHIIPRFRIATVFDVSQTYGEPLPELETPELMGNVENYEVFMQALREISPVPIRFDEIESGAKGYYSTMNKETVIQQGMSEMQTMKTGIHETTHAKLHDREIMEELGEKKNQMTKEVEAESVAYTVCQYFGLDTSDYSFPYIAGWSSSVDMKELRASMDTIRKTAGEMIDGMTEVMQQLMREQPIRKEFARNDFILKLSGSMGSEYAYDLVEGITTEDLRTMVKDYSHMVEQNEIAEDELPLEYYLEEHGAVLTTLYTSSGVGEDHPITFFDVEYDVDTGVAFLKELAAEERAEMLIEKAEFPEPFFSDSQKAFIKEFSEYTNNLEILSDLVWEMKAAIETPDPRRITEVMEAARERFMTKENLVLDGSGNHYGIYQLKESEDRGYQFMGMNEANRFGFEIHGKDYELIYSDRLESEDTLDSLYEKFNINHPAGYEGHSLSVSDVIVLQKDGKAEAYYVDSIGFQELPDFVQQRLHEAEMDRKRWFAPVTLDSDAVAIEQHEGYWHPVERLEAADEVFYLMKHNEYGDSVAAVIVNSEGDLVAQDLEKGIDRGAIEAVREYLTDKGREWEPGEQELEKWGIKAEIQKDSGKTELTQKKYPPVYQHTLTYAMEHAEADDYLDSRRINIACKNAVEEAIDNHFDGMRLDSDVVEPVLEEYGQERLTYVLACTLQYKSWDGRFSRENKTWAESISVEENVNRGVDANTDYVVDSHPAVLDGFVNLARKKFAEREQVQQFIAQYYVVNDAYGVKTERKYQYFTDIKDALKAYHLLPNHLDKQIGMESTEQPPSRMELISCNNGLEEMEDIYSDKWLNPETEAAQQAAEEYLGSYYKEVAYWIEHSGKFLYVQTGIVGYDYTLYDKEYRELDGGIYSDPELTMRGALEEILADEERLSIDDCEVIDCEKFLETVDRAEYFPQKSYEALKGLMNSGADKIAFRTGYGYALVQQVQDGYNSIVYDSDYREIGGKFYDVPDASMEEAVGWLFKDEDLGKLDCEPFTYDELKKNALQAVQERLKDNQMTPTSQISIRESSLNGQCRHDIEETVLCYAQAQLEDMGLAEEVKLNAARVYGSRTRAGLYNNGSDVDVALSYSGNIREDDFFSALHKAGMAIAGLPLDINPVSTEKTGTLQEYLEQAEKYLDDKELLQLAYDIDQFSAEYDLYQYRDSVDDREENVDMIYSELVSRDAESIRKWVEKIAADENDDPPEVVEEAKQLMARIEQAQKMGRAEIVHNPEKADAKITFYVAECMEFPILGEYQDNLTLKEAVQKYEEIPADRINGIKGIGFRLEDGSIYDGDYELMSAGVISKDLIDLVPHYKESPLVQQAIADLEQILSDRRQEKTAEKPQEKQTQKETEQAQEPQISVDEGKAASVPETASEQKKQPETVPGKDNSVSEGTGRKQSVLKALRERQAKLKQEQKSTEQKAQNHKKGEQEL